MACLTEVIGEDNSEHFFVASQDADLRKKFQEVYFILSLMVYGNFKTISYALLCLFNEYRNQLSL